MKITIPQIKKLCFQVFEKNGVSKKDGELIFAEYLDGELRGRNCHGFLAFVKFGAKMLNKSEGRPKVIKQAPSYTIIDGKRNLGQIVCAEWVPKTIQKAKKQGIAMLGISRMHSYLMPGTYARYIAEKDMIAIIFNHSGALRIAPTGGKDKMIGTNPIAVGIPSSGLPIVLDMATSSISMNKVRLAKQLGKLLPAGVALDKNGKPTRDPQKALDGAMLSFDGYKGYGLALVVEIFTRVLFNLKPNTRRGYMFIIIDPKIFGSVNAFKKRVAKYTKDIKKSRKKKGVKEIYFPGEKSEKTKQANLKKKYLEIDDKIIEEIKAQL